MGTRIVAAVVLVGLPIAIGVFTLDRGDGSDGVTFTRESVQETMTPVVRTQVEAVVSRSQGPSR
jgi:hypothetical protein